jgi:hypothetical protein
MPGHIDGLAAKEHREHKESGIFRLLFSPIALDMPEGTD